MSENVTLVAGTLAPPACYQSEQQRYEAYIAATTGTVPSGYIQWVVSASTPGAGDRDKLWLQIDANGNPLEAFRYVSGAWRRWENTPLLGLVSGGAGNAYTITNSPVELALVPLKIYTFIANHSCTGASTLNIDGLGATAITRANATALQANDIVNGQVCVVLYDGTQFQLISDRPANASATYLYPDALVTLVSLAAGSVLPAAAWTLVDLTAQANAVSLSNPLRAILRARIEWVGGSVGSSGGPSRGYIKFSSLNTGVIANDDYRNVSAVERWDDSASGNADTSTIIVPLVGNQFYYTYYEVGSNTGRAEWAAKIWLEGFEK